MTATTCEYAGGCSRPVRIAIIYGDLAQDWRTVRLFCGPSHAALNLIALAERTGGVEDDLTTWAALHSAPVTDEHIYRDDRTSGERNGLSTASPARWRGPRS